MQTKRILKFLEDIKKNNNREWFLSHRDEYLFVREDFEKEISKAILAIAEFDPSIKHITPKDAMYRFNRDTRFSPDKSPYKTHLGAYIAAHGKKNFHGGYYIHLEPGHCLLATGSYYLPANILTSCRNEIMANILSFRRIVESAGFIKFFGTVGKGSWDSSKGFGLESLKTAPKNFPRNYKYLKYLRLKDYCCWRGVRDDFFDKDSWIKEMVKTFKTAKPLLDFINSVIDDYE